MLWACRPSAAASCERGLLLMAGAPADDGRVALFIREERCRGGSSSNAEEQQQWRQSGQQQQGSHSMTAEAPPSPWLWAQMVRSLWWLAARHSACWLLAIRAQVVLASMPGCCRHQGGVVGFGTAGGSDGGVAGALWLGLQCLWMSCAAMATGNMLQGLQQALSRTRREQLKL